MTGASTSSPPTLPDAAEPAPQSRTPPPHAASTDHPGASLCSDSAAATTTTAGRPPSKDEWEVLPAGARRATATLLTAFGLMVASLGIVHTVVPLMLRRTVGPAAAAAWQGALTVVTAGSGLTLSLLLGYWSDRVGRVGLLRLWAAAWAGSISLVAAAAAYGEPRLLLPARLVAFSVPVVLVFALTSDIVQGAALLQIHGGVGAVYGGAMTVGLTLAAVVGHGLSLDAALLAAIGLAGAAAAVVMTLPPPPHVPSRHDGPLRSLRVVWRAPTLRWLMLGYAVFRVGNVHTAFLFVLFVEARFGWGVWEAGLLLAAMSGLSVVTQTLGVRRIVARGPAGVTRAFVALLAAYPLVMVAYGVLTSPVLFSVAVLSASVNGVIIALFSSQISGMAHEDGLTGLALGVAGSMQNLLEVPIGAAFGLLLSRSIDHCAGLHCGVPYLVNAGIYVLAFAFTSVALRSAPLSEAGASAAAVDKRCCASALVGDISSEACCV